ncbi:hypothetical protein VN12_18240 [Pirellula sp. SH-Sr6A]|uniref:hypothetical protein n=1 Tax=Pirellula sp. SH-Sr6A TaxID=1632865 RepID=UPI00078D4EA3|nr:hypothetical protein [Pirellula sp. SH-Sr6A]AMV34076.1 hypothetical protein VN12_18240 [Pirellula sp. SH-Sr6A]
MSYLLSRFRSLALFFCAIVLSGLPLPMLDAHPTNSSEVSKHPALLAHLQNTPASEHQGVEDSEVHVHWISILLASNANPEANASEPSVDLVGISIAGTDSVPLCVVQLWGEFQWPPTPGPRVASPRFAPSLSHGIRTTRLLL